MIIRKKIILREEDEHEEAGFFDQPDNITVRTQAAIDMVRIAESLGFLDRLALVMSWRCGNIGGVAASSPRQPERRYEKWRGEEERGKDTVSEDHTSTGGNIELKLSELPARQRWSIFLRNERQEREKRSSKKKSREE